MAPESANRAIRYDVPMTGKVYHPARLRRAGCGAEVRIAPALVLMLALVLMSAAPARLLAAAEPHRLPEIGDPSYSTLSLPDEKKLGRAILAQLRASLPLTGDIEIQSYLRSLGTRLLSQDADNKLDFHFLPVADRAINAFATPGGIVVINEGLMLFADNESELAGVVAHEIAHVTRRHIARLRAELQTTSWISALILIAGLMASTYNPELAQLAVHVGTSLPIEQQLSYSRNLEYEADRSAIRLMAQARINPRGVSRFFSKLQAREGRRQVPEFLRTHPLTIGRLRSAEERAARYPEDLHLDSKAFRHIHARLRALKDLEPAPGETETTSLQLYRKGISLTRRQLSYEAIQTFGRIPEEERGLPVLLALSQARIAQGDYRKARDDLAALNELHPGRASINYYLASCLLRIGEADRALEHLRKIKSLHRYHPQLYKLSAEAAAALGRDSLGHEYLADYYLAGAHFNLALNQLNLAERAPGVSRGARARIKSKRDEIVALQQEFKSRL